MRTDKDRIAAAERLLKRADTAAELTDEMREAIAEHERLHRGERVPSGRVPFAGAMVTPRAYAEMAKSAAPRKPALAAGAQRDSIDAEIRKRSTLYGYVTKVIA